MAATDRVTAACPGVPAPVRPAALTVMPEGQPPHVNAAQSASAWLARCRYAPARLPPLFKRPGSPSVVPSFHGSDLELQPDILTINVRLISGSPGAAC